MKYLRLYEDIDFNKVDDFDELLEEFEGYEDFYNFLVNHDSLDEYVSNFKDKNKNFNYPLYYKKVKDFLDKASKYEYISMAFDWGNDRKWSHIHNDWIRYLVDNY
jgi:hypothetical protein